MKKILLLLFLLIVFLFLFNFYNPFNINIFGNKEKAYINKENIINKEQSKQIKKTPQTYFSIGEQFLNKKKYKSAISNFSKAIELDSNYIEAYQKRALAKDNIGDFEGSKEDYNQYITLLEKQNKDEYEKNKYEINNLIDKIRTKIFNKKYNEAIADSNNIIETYPTYSNGYTIRADTYFSMQKYNQALDDYKKALSLSLENKNFTLYLKIANTEYELGLYKDSISNYLHVINLNPNYEYAYYKLIGAYIFVENFNNALSILTKYSKISKTKKIQVKDYSIWIAILNKYTENEIIRDLKKNLKELAFVQS